MDSEIITMNKGAKEAAWLEKVIENLGERGSDPYIYRLSTAIISEALI